MTRMGYLMGRSSGLLRIAQAILPIDCNLMALSTQSRTEQSEQSKTEQSRAEKDESEQSRLVTEQNSLQSIISAQPYATTHS